jgi:hypothetical protein
MPFKKGQSGNPGGRPSYKQFTECLRLHLLREAGAKFELAKTFSRLDVIAMSLVQNAMKGEGWAIKEVADRIEGRCIQPNEITGRDGEAIKSEIKITNAGDVVLGFIEEYKPVKKLS